MSETIWSPTAAPPELERAIIDVLRAQLRELVATPDSAPWHIRMDLDMPTPHRVELRRLRSAPARRGPRAALYLELGGAAATHGVLWDVAASALVDEQTRAAFEIRVRMRRRDVQ